jgi:F-type H+-transporting ATPase subunit alpha
VLSSVYTLSSLSTTQFRGFATKAAKVDKGTKKKKEMKKTTTTKTSRLKIPVIGTRLEFRHSGTVTSVADGVVTVRGLGLAMVGEMVVFRGGIRGMVLNLEPSVVKIALFGADQGISEGTHVFCTGRVVSVRAGAFRLGTHVDGIGNAFTEASGFESPETTELRRVELKAPGIIFRQAVYEPLQTGLKAVDSMVPIGRGQRELIIGDRQTGKSSVAIDTIINQSRTVNEFGAAENWIFSVYVSTGQRRSDVSSLVTALKTYGGLGLAFNYACVVSATSSDPAALQYIAPYTGCAIGEWFRDNGMHAVIVYDDLSKQAVSYRQMSLLLRRPPARDAFPGDVFYLHSRLLERAAKLSSDIGAGSLTALPIVETQAGDVSAFIPTNVISITDGQIFLCPGLFRAGVRPAVDVGVSVSRVGSSAQVGGMKEVAGYLKLELAQYAEAKSFERFASDLDPVTANKIVRGSRLVEILIQPQYEPLSVPKQIITVYAGIQGFLDSLSLEEIRIFVRMVNTQLAIQSDFEWSSSATVQVQTGNLLFSSRMVRWLRVIESLIRGKARPFAFKLAPWSRVALFVGLGWITKGIVASRSAN